MRRLFIGADPADDLLTLTAEEWSVIRKIAKLIHDDLTDERNALARMADDGCPNVR